MKLLKTTPTLEGTEYRLNNWVIVALFAAAIGYGYVSYTTPAPEYLKAACITGLSVGEMNEA